MADGPRFSAGFGHQVAGVLVPLLQPYCERIEVAGSLRRQCRSIHDLDLVLYPRAVILGQQASLFDSAQVETVLRPAFIAPLVEKKILPAVLLNPTVRSEWPGQIRFTFQGLPVDLYLTQPSGCNLGALLQMRTGPAQLNQALAARALQLGWSYRAGYGLFDANGARLDDDTEAGIFRLLGLRFVPPLERDTFFWGSWVLPAPLSNNTGLGS